MTEKKTLKELFVSYNAKKISRQELNSSCVKILAKIDTNYHAFISYAEDIDLGERPLYPSVVADNICLEGLKTTAGSEILEDYQSPFTAFALEKAYGNGFRFLGKTNVDEFGIGDYTGTSYYKTTLNPFSENYLAGSGAAAAVAVGGATAGFASDARGGLRQAASFCGLVGLKPTYGRVSRRGLIEYASSLDHIGVLAQTVSDAAFSFKCISGVDPKDPTSQEGPIRSDSGDLKGKIACLQGWDKVEGLTDAVREVFEGSMRHLKDVAGEVKEYPFPYLPLATRTVSLIGAVEAFSNLANFDGIRFGKRAKGDHLQDMYMQTRTAYLGERTKAYLTFGALMSSGKNYQDYFLWAQKNRRVIFDTLMRLFLEVDFILLPCVPHQAPVLTDLDDKDNLENPADVYTSLANLAGIPAITVPVGLHKGLPVGIQLMGRPFSEAALLKMAKALEEKFAVSAHLPHIQEVL